MHLMEMPEHFSGCDIAMGFNPFLERRLVILNFGQYLRRPPVVFANEGTEGDLEFFFVVREGLVFVEIGVSDVFISILLHRSAEITVRPHINRPIGECVLVVIFST